MPTRISSGAGNNLFFLTFYSYDPIDCKLLIFPLTSLFAFKHES